MRTLLRAIMLLSAVAGVFLTFVWPLAVASDPSDALYRKLAIATVCALLASVGACAFLAARARRRNG